MCTCCPNPFATPVHNAPTLIVDVYVNSRVTEVSRKHSVRLTKHEVSLVATNSRTPTRLHIPLHLLCTTVRHVLVGLRHMITVRFRNSTTMPTTASSHAPVGLPLARISSKIRMTTWNDPCLVVVELFGECNCATYRNRFMRMAEKYERYSEV